MEILPEYTEIVVEIFAEIKKTWTETVAPMYKEARFYSLSNPKVVQSNGLHERFHCILRQNICSYSALAFLYPYIDAPLLSGTVI